MDEIEEKIENLKKSKKRLQAILENLESNLVKLCKDKKTLKCDIESGKLKSSYRRENRRLLIEIMVLIPKIEELVEKTQKEIDFVRNQINSLRNPRESKYSRMLRNNQKE